MKDERRKETHLESIPWQGQGKDRKGKEEMKEAKKENSIWVNILHYIRLRFITSLPSLPSLPPVSEFVSCQWGASRETRPAPIPSPLPVTQHAWLMLESLLCLMPLCIPWFPVSSPPPPPPPSPSSSLHGLNGTSSCVTVPPTYIVYQCMTVSVCTCASLQNIKSFTAESIQTYPERGIQKRKRIAARQTKSSPSTKKNLSAILTSSWSPGILDFVRGVVRTYHWPHIHCMFPATLKKKIQISKEIKNRKARVWQQWRLWCRRHFHRQQRSAEWLSLICPCCEAAEVASAAWLVCHWDEETGGLLYAAALLYKGDF